LDLEQKNLAELLAELEFYKHQSESLEAELKAMDLELHVYRKKNNESRLLQDQILFLESQTL
jgi:prefoldin subunit 5